MPDFKAELTGRLQTAEEVCALIKLGGRKPAKPRPSVMRTPQIRTGSAGLAERFIIRRIG